jgi:hypothetical protein
MYCTGFENCTTQLYCGDGTVNVDSRDLCSLGDLLMATQGRAPELPFLWVDDPRLDLCVEIHHD